MTAMLHENKKRDMIRHDLNKIIEKYKYRYTEYELSRIMIAILAEKTKNMD
jgi:hypothetical protein